MTSDARSSAGGSIDHSGSRFSANASIAVVARDRTVREPALDGAPPHAPGVVDPVRDLVRLRERAQRGERLARIDRALRQREHLVLRRVVSELVGDDLERFEHLVRARRARRLTRREEVAP
jgi:hypothetical protein